MASGQELYPIPLPSHRPPTSPTVSLRFERSIPIADFLICALAPMYEAICFCLFELKPSDEEA